MRRTPYTEIGIARLPCFRCGAKPSVYQWQICADGRVYRGVCISCDVKLNQLVLRWAGFPDWKEKMKHYKTRVALR